MFNAELYQSLIQKNRLYPNLIRQLVNSFYNLTDFEDISPWGSVFCMFHDDKSGGKPSAKLYVDEDGSETLFCFSERKRYSAYDYIKLILQKEPLKYLLENQSDDEIKFMIQDIISNGKAYLRKSKLDIEKAKELTEKEFINYICTGDFCNKSLK